MNSRATVIGHERLKRTRLDCSLTFRDVERLSRVLADHYGDDRLIVRVSVLARAENQEVVPNVFHLHSLCVIYSVDMREVLRWYGISDGPSRRAASRWLRAAAYKSDSLQPASQFRSRRAAASSGS